MRLTAEGFLADGGRQDESGTEEHGNRGLRAVELRARWSGCQRRRLTAEEFLADGGWQDEAAAEEHGNHGEASGAVVGMPMFERRTRCDGFATSAAMELTTEELLADGGCEDESAAEKHGNGGLRDRRR
jgi:hypothetical protein